MSAARTKRLPLRLRLTLWFMTVLLVTQGTISFGVVLFRRKAQHDEFSFRLRADIEHIADRLAVRGVPTDATTTRQLVPQGVALRRLGLFDSADAPLAVWPKAADSIPLSDAREYELESGVILEFEVARSEARDQDLGARRLRGVATWVETQQGPVLVEVLRDAGLVETYLGQLGTLILAQLAISLLGAALAAWIVLGHALAPLQQIEEEAGKLEPAALDERIEIDAEGAEPAGAAAALNRALDRLEDGFRAQERFLANVSHELKTPIATLLAEVGALPADEQVPAAQRAFNESVGEELRRLGRIVESFLTLSQVEHGTRELNLAPGWFNDVLLDAVQACSPLAQVHDVHIALTVIDSGSDEFVGDAQLLQSVVENLVRNALRFAPARSTVEIEAWDLTGSLGLEVRDMGPGIPEELRATIFEPFEQAPGERHANRGSGIGLAIARRVVELHGGAIEARERAGGGTVMAVTLPVRSEADWARLDEPDGDSTPA